MDVMSYCISSDVTNCGANQKQFGNIGSQSAANGPHQKTEEAPPTRSDRLQDDVSGHDLATNSCSTNDVSELQHTETDSAPRRQKGVDSSSVSPSPLCSPPSSSSPSPRPPLSPSSTCSLHHHQRHHQHCTNQKTLSSTRSHTSSQAGPAHIKEVAGDDCCLHCLLACLFCEVLSMCSALGECLVCAVGGASCCDSSVCCCCCVEAAAEEACQTVLDCGILETCCSSSDCLEICLECCSICFPT